MLVLSRRQGEILKIGDDIEIINLGTSGDKVRLGITAPDHISVHRQEVYEKIHQTTKEGEKDHEQ